ncbi:MAG: AbrB/MazE/SpoVT family DNA-binding domain-containing protein [Kiritimatiellales bacterium]
MKNKTGAGIVRKVDHMGRVVIPSEMRKALGISNGDAVTFSLRDDGVVIARHNECGAVDEYLKRIALNHPELTVIGERVLESHLAAIQKLFR